MSNSPTPTGTGGGMPKWLVFVLVALLIIILGCCGGFVACRWACQRAREAGSAAVMAATQRAETELRAATQRAAAEAAAEAARRGAGAGATAGETDTPETPAAGGGTSRGTSGSTGGSTPQRTIAQDAGAGKLPANFPSDIPVMKGLSASGISTADKIKGSGFIMLTGTVKQEDVAAYYDKEMKSQGWSQTSNQDILGQTIMEFTKNNLKATVQVVKDTDTSSAVNIAYGPK